MEKKNDFQIDLKRLDEIVSTISDKALPLDESLKLYEEGKAIIKKLSLELEEAEKKVENIIDVK